jgi:deferrochelatase/peroxidase EfeB
LRWLPGAVTVTHRQDAAMLDPRGDRPLRRTEHFGFADGFGQPQIDGSGAPEYRGDGTPDGAGGWQAGGDRRIHPRLEK